jgi:hypothetical protein
VSRRLKAYKSNNGQHYHYVAAPNLKAAAELLNTTVGDLRRFGYEVGPKDAAMIIAWPWWIWRRPMSFAGSRPPLERWRPAHGDPPPPQQEPPA